MVEACLVNDVFSSHLFFVNESAGVTTEEGHTGILIHLASPMLAYFFLARRIQPPLSLVDRDVQFCILTIYFIVLHLLGIYYYVYFFFVRKNLSYGDSNSRPNVSEDFEELPTEPPGRSANVNNTTACVFSL